MTQRKMTAKQQNEAYDHGYRSCQFRDGKAYRNPYDSDRFWLLFMAYEQGWNDRCEWEVDEEARRARAERQAREIRETAETLIEERGAANARAWAEHCMVRDSAGGFWRAVLFEIDRRCAAEIFAKCRAARAAREATRVGGRLP